MFSNPFTKVNDISFRTALQKEMGLCIGGKILLLLKYLHPETLESVLDLVRKNTKKSLLNNSIL